LGISSYILLLGQELSFSGQRTEQPCQPHSQYPFVIGKQSPQFLSAIQLKIPNGLTG
jgi:hypothetical protein